MIYLIYGKAGGMRCYRPVDVQSGKFQINIFHATIFFVEADAEKCIKMLREENQEILFEIRKQK
jgi:hypothetical protein